MAKGYSHIVIGAGAIGSAAAYWLSERGAEQVLVVEQFDLVNSLGSSGITRASFATHIIARTTRG